MYVDKQNVLEMSWSQVRSAGTDFADGCIDLGVSARDVGAGRPTYVVIDVLTDFAATDTATVQFRLLEDAASGIDSDSAILSETEDFAYSTLTAGRELIVIPVPPGVALRYLGLGVVISTYPITAGKIDVFLTTEAQTNA